MYLNKRHTLSSVLNAPTYTLRWDNVMHFLCSTSKHWRYIVFHNRQPLSTPDIICNADFVYKVDSESIQVTNCHGIHNIFYYFRPSQHLNCAQLVLFTVQWRVTRYCSRDGNNKIVSWSIYAVQYMSWWQQSTFLWLRNMSGKMSENCKCILNVILSVILPTNIWYRLLGFFLLRIAVVRNNLRRKKMYNMDMILIPVST